MTKELKEAEFTAFLREFHEMMGVPHKNCRKMDKDCVFLKCFKNMSRQERIKILTDTDFWSDIPFESRWYEAEKNLGYIEEKLRYFNEPGFDR